MCERVLLLGGQTPPPLELEETLDRDNGDRLQARLAGPSVETGRVHPTRAHPDQGKGPRSKAQALMRISTPAGMFRLLRASTVCEVGSEMKISRLCVRISNCSRDFLSMNGERRTV